jgi:hypothetical protein
MRRKTLLEEPLRFYLIFTFFIRVNEAQNGMVERNAGLRPERVEFRIVRVATRRQGRDEIVFTVARAPSGEAKARTGTIAVKGASNG